MVGRLLSFWDNLFSGAMLVSGRVNHSISRWWQLKYFLFSPRSPGKRSNLTNIFFKWVAQPPTRTCNWILTWKNASILLGQWMIHLGCFFSLWARFLPGIFWGWYEWYQHSGRFGEQKTQNTLQLSENFCRNTGLIPPQKVYHFRPWKPWWQRKTILSYWVR